MKPWVTAIVPTVGRSPWLLACLEALRRSGGNSVEILLVAQGRTALAVAEDAARLADRTLYLYDSVGFAAANNHALADAAESELVATVNDDVVVGEDWYPNLVKVFDEEPSVAAVQGVNTKLGESDRLDGCGIAWNRHWQAIQIGHGEPAAAAPEVPVEIFGPSATAAVYRRRALVQAGVSPQARALFDSRLGSYYEDVDLACRLRGAGYSAWLVPAARAEHAGSTTAATMPLGSWQLVYGNRYLVLARLLGRRFYGRLPAIWPRDAADLWGAFWHGDAGRAAAVLAGWARAAFLLRHYAHRGEPRVGLEELRRFTT